MLSTEKARRLVRDVEFPGDADSAYRIAVGGKQKRKALISQVESKDRETAGAIEIQRTWRGFRTRQKYISITGRKKTAGVRVETARFPLLKRRYEDYVKWCSRELGVGSGSGSVMDFSEYCARVIQVWWRTVRDTHRQTRKRRLTEQEAVRKIQTAWKGYRSKKIFNFYRELINFKQRGDPAILLKTINPMEAKLLDRASGACVRFRLGGCDFPPSVYYKIFTNQAVVDVCSYSPRDYTAMISRRQLQRDRHNHAGEGRAVKDDDSGSSWYKRWENNGWRLVSERLFQSRFQDSVTVETSAKRRTFHHSTLQRRADLEKRQKKKKREWMKKLYSPQRETMSSEKEEAETVDSEDEVEDLLGWSQSLNYEEYVSDWCQIATSAALPSSHDCHMTT